MDKLLKKTEIDPALLEDDDYRTENAISIQVIQTMHQEMIDRGFDRFSSNETLCLAAMVDPRMRKIAIKDEEAYESAKILLMDEARAIELKPHCESQLTEPVLVSTGAGAPDMEENQNDESIYAELKAEAAASIRASRSQAVSDLASDEECKAYLSVPNIEILENPLKW